MPYHFHGLHDQSAPPYSCTLRSTEPGRSTTPSSCPNAEGHLEDPQSTLQERKQLPYTDDMLPCTPPQTPVSSIHSYGALSQPSDTAFRPLRACSTRTSFTSSRTTRYTYIDKIGLLKFGNSYVLIDVGKDFVQNKSDVVQSHLQGLARIINHLLIQLRLDC